MQSTSDDVLIGRIATGDRLAMQVLFARHHVRVYRFVLRLVRDELVAEDLISEVFLDVWRQAGRFEGRSQVSTWLLAIARFKALSALRRRPDEELDDETAEAIEILQTIRKLPSTRRTKVRRSGSVLRSFRQNIGRSSTWSTTTRNQWKKSPRSSESRKYREDAHVLCAQRLAELLKAAGIERGWP